MFTYFNKNKLKYNKGQLAPFFIVILVVIITMAMVTLNLSKVALIKTDTSNAADAGALAAGSVMANVFNSVAKANAQMEVDYQMFIATTSVLFAVATTILAFSLATACSPLACTAAAAMAVVPKIIMAIGIAAFLFAIGQVIFYQMIRDIGEKGRDGAIKIGHEFVFMNSGIGIKLKEGDIQGHNYRSAFRSFINDEVGSEPTYNYSWQDGQGRQHNVTSNVGIDEVNTFNMQVTLLPSLAVTALLILSKLEAAEAIPELAMACTCFTKPITCPALGQTCALAIRALIVSLVSLVAAWAGLLPGAVISDNGSLLNAFIWTYCWIDDINHNRLVRVDTNQHHEGADLGLWQTRYPDTRSSSEVNFSGEGGGSEGGSIYPPRLMHDASITQVDF